MSRLNRVRNNVLGIEAIQYQGKSKLFTLLEDGIATVQTIVKGNGINAECKRELTKLAGLAGLELGTGFNFKIDPASYINAWVFPPHMDINHPFYKPWEYMRDNSFKKFTSKGAKKLLETAKEAEGWVDLENSKIGGVFSKTTCYVHITLGCLNNLTSAEITSIILHELGHVFSYFEYLGTNVSRNLALVAVTEDLFEDNNNIRRVRLVESVRAQLELDVEADAVARAPNKKAALTLLLDANIQSIRSEMGSDYYDQTAWESQADLFATRHGAGEYLVGALAKMTPKTSSTVNFVLGEFIFVAANISLLILTAFAWIGRLIFIILTANSVDLYDKPERRLQRIREQVLGELKDKTLDKDRVKEILSSLKTIDKALEGYKDRNGVLDLIQLILIKGKRNDQRQRELQVKLEKLAYNDLYISSAKLSSYT